MRLERAQPEQEQVLGRERRLELPNGAVARAEDHGAARREPERSGACRTRAGGARLVGEIGPRHQQLDRRGVAARQHGDAQRAPDALVGVDRIAHGAQQPEQALVPGPAGGVVPGEHDGTRSGRRPAARREAQVLAHQAEDAQQRPLVRGERAEPHVHERLRIELDANGLAHERAEALAIRATHRPERRAEGGVERQRLELGEALRVARPAAAELLREQLGELRVGVDHEAAREHGRAALRERRAAQLAEVGEDLAGRAVPGCRDRDAPARHDRQLAEPQPPRRALAKQRQPAPAPAVAGPGGLDRVEMAPVDLVQDLEQPERLSLQVSHGPVRAARLAVGGPVARDERRTRARPGLVPAQALLVEQDPHPLGDRDRSALVGEQQRAAVGLRRADRARRQRELRAQPHGVLRRPDPRRREHVLRDEAPRGAQRGHELLQRLDPGAGGEDVHSAAGARHAHSFCPRRSLGERRPAL